MVSQKTRSRKETAGKSPDQQRRERAAVEFHSYTFRLMTVRTSVGNRGLVYVTSGSGNTYCCTDNGRCDCIDFQRRRQPCKHRYAVERWLAGDVPDEAEVNALRLPAAPFDIAAEERYHQALRDRELWDGPEIRTF